MRKKNKNPLLFGMMEIVSENLSNKALVSFCLESGKVDSSSALIQRSDTLLRLRPGESR